MGGKGRHRILSVIKNFKNTAVTASASGPGGKRGRRGRASPGPAGQGEGPAPCTVSPRGTGCFPRRKPMALSSAECGWYGPRRLPLCCGHVNTRPFSPSCPGGGDEALTAGRPPPAALEVTPGRGGGPGRGPGLRWGARLRVATEQSRDLAAGTRHLQTTWPGAEAQQDQGSADPTGWGECEEGRTVPGSLGREAFPSGQGRGGFPGARRVESRVPGAAPVRAGNSQRVLGGWVLQAQGLFWKLENLERRGVGGGREGRTS